MKKQIAGLLVLMFMAPTIQATMIKDAGAWGDLPQSLKTGYVIAFIDSHYFVVSGNFEVDVDNPKIRECIEGMDTDDFIEIINIRYNDLENYRAPPWSQLNRGIREMCGLSTVEK